MKHFSKLYSLNSKHDYNKVCAYALLYSSFTETPVLEITVSFVVTVHPRDLIKYLKMNVGLRYGQRSRGLTSVKWYEKVFDLQYNHLIECVLFSHQ